MGVKYELTRIVWRDAWQVNDLPLEELGGVKECLATTVGYVVKDDKDVLGLAAELVYNPDDQRVYGRAVTFVPTCLITKRRKVADVNF